MFPKIGGGKTPQNMDGENNGKPLLNMGWFGGPTQIFGNTHFHPFGTTINPTRLIWDRDEVFIFSLKSDEETSPIWDGIVNYLSGLFGLSLVLFSLGDFCIIFAVYYWVIYIWVNFPQLFEEIEDERLQENLRSFRAQFGADLEDFGYQLQRRRVARLCQAVLRF